MSSGYRSLFAFWLGGAARPASTAARGTRSMLAPWIGGAARPGGAVADRGTRSMLAPWIGGAASLGGAIATRGSRSLLAFWIGGAATAGGVPPAPPAPTPGSGTWGVRTRDRELRELVAKLHRQTEEFGRLLTVREEYDTQPAAAAPSLTNGQLAEILDDDDEVLLLL